MTIHSKTEEMLKESLQEMHAAAGLCIKYEKANKGCLGYPAAILLLSIADAIGSYYRANTDFLIQIDDKAKTINGGAFKHFYIFNSHYYDLQLSEESIKKIYSNYRSLLVHNAVIAKRHFITIDDPLHRCFSEDGLYINEQPYPCMHLKPLLRATRFAVENFSKEIDEVVPKSKQGEIIAKKN